MTMRLLWVGCPSTRVTHVPKAGHGAPLFVVVSEKNGRQQVRPLRSE